jgi:DNA-binding transcriptional regulator YhcF (GntR family)/AcrR family transcriptional regulator
MHTPNIFAVERTGVPIYVQIRDHLLGRIASGDLTPGRQMPTMRQVASDLAVDLNTVRHAYDELAARGAVRVVRGRGTFVATPDGAGPPHQPEPLRASAPMIAPPLGRRGAGRPRDPEIEARFKQAALEILAEFGFGGLTLDRICARAKAPAATFYRRWSTPTVLVSEAFNERFEIGFLEMSGDLPADLMVFTDKLLALYTDPLLGPCLSFIWPETRLRPDLLEPMAEAERGRRKTNVETLENALREQGYGPHITAKMLLFVLNNVTYMTYVTGRKVSRDDFKALITQLLLTADP